MADNYIDLPVEGTGGSSGVSSLNGLTGALTLVGGAHITITPLGSIITIATTGLIASINGDSTSAQTLTTGTSGTDFAIVDNGLGDHKFNLPTASAVNRGALSSADWSTFNSKQPAGSYITSLTGDVTAVGPGAAAATVARIRGTTVSAVAPTNAQFLVYNSGTTQYVNVSLSSDATMANTGALTLANTAVTPGSYTLTNLTVDSKGRITSAANGSVSLTTQVTGVLPIANGGTSQTTAAAARTAAGLNIDQRSTFSNANYTALSTDRYVAQVGTMSAVRTVTLPAASSVNPGQLLIIIDESGTVSTTNTISIARAGADTINGLTSASVRTPYGQSRLYSDGVSKWTDAVLGITRGGTGIITLPTNGQLLIGNTTTSAYSQSTLTAGPGITITNGAGSIQINNSSIGVGTLASGILSDGVDGDVTISVNTTLTRDMDYNNLTVNAGITLNPGGFVIFVKNTLTIAATGIISRPANAGGNSGGSTAGAAGAALAGTTVGTTGAGGAGAAGDLDSGASGATSAAISGEGGVGGVGGNAGQGAGGTFPGGSGGNAGVVTIRYFRNTQAMWKYTAVGTYMPTGSGGGGGAAGGGDLTNNGRGGGGGGAAGPPIFILCGTLANSGTIRSKGGAGGNGGAGATGNVGGGAGGGGGGGGKIMILCNTVTSVGTLDVSGGARGTGSAGAGTGTAGSDGGDGGSGYATVFEASTGTWTTTS